MREVRGSKPRYSSFPFAPSSLLLLPLSSLLREACAEKEGAPKFLLLFRSRKSRKRAAHLNVAG